MVAIATVVRCLPIDYKEQCKIKKQEYRCWRGNYYLGFRLNVRLCNFISICWQHGLKHFVKKLLGIKWHAWCRKLNLEVHRQLQMETGAVRRKPDTLVIRRTRISDEKQHIHQVNFNLSCFFSSILCMDSLYIRKVHLNILLFFFHNSWTCVIFTYDDNHLSIKSFSMDRIHFCKWWCLLWLWGGCFFEW